MAKGGKRGRANSYGSSRGTHPGKWGGGKEHADIYHYDGRGKQVAHHHISAEHWRTNVGGGGGEFPCCLVATAYGSSLDTDVQMLRDFRDTKLTTNLLGRIFVNLYNRISPSLAQVIKNNLSLKTVARIILRLPVRLIKLL